MATYPKSMCDRWSHASPFSLALRRQRVLRHGTDVFAEPVRSSAARRAARVTGGIGGSSPTAFTEETSDGWTHAKGQQTDWSADNWSSVTDDSTVAKPTQVSDQGEAVSLAKEDDCMRDSREAVQDWY